MTDISKSHDNASHHIYRAQELLNFLFEAVAGNGTPISAKQLSTYIEVVQDKLAVAMEFIDSAELNALIPAGGQHAA